MGMNKVGIGAVLSFDSRAAVKNMKTTNNSFHSLHKTASRSGQALGKTSIAVKALSLGFGRMNTTALIAGSSLLPLTFAAGSMMQTFIDFDKQMSAVQSVLRATKEEMGPLRKEAMRLGATTQFTATQSSEAMEVLARAGLNQSQIIQATGSVLNLAAADSMEMAVAADIASLAMKGLGLQASDMGHIADVLALTSSKTNTNVTELGEAFKMSTSAASVAGIELEELSALLGTLADSGLKGTLGGTSLSNMLMKLAKPTKTAKRFMKKFHISLTDTDGQLRKTGHIVNDFQKAINSLGNEETRVAVATELFGRRGVRAYNAIARKGVPALMQLEDALKNADGSAKKMADIRLQNFAGELTIIKSIFETLQLVSVGAFKGMNAGVDSFIHKFRVGFGQVVDVIQKVLDGQHSFKKEFAEFGTLATSIGIGFGRGIRYLTEALSSVENKFNEIGSSLVRAFGRENIADITQFAVVIAGIGAAVAPVLAGLTAIGIAVSFVGPLISGLAGMILPVTIAIGAAVLIFQQFRRDGESIGETFTRAFDYIASTFDTVMIQYIEPLWDGLVMGWLDSMTDLEKAWDDYMSNISEIFGEVIDQLQWFFQIFSGDAEDAGYTVATAFFDVLEFGLKTSTALLKPFIDSLKLMGWVLDGIGKLANLVFKAINEGFRFLSKSIGNIVQQFTSVYSKLRNVPGIGDKLPALPDSVKNFTIKDIGLNTDNNLIDFKFKTRAEQNVIDDKKQASFKTERQNRQIQRMRDRHARDMARMDADAKRRKEKRQADAQREFQRELQESFAESLKNQKPPKVNVNNKFNLDGKEISRNQSQLALDVADRTTFKQTPFARKRALQQGFIQRR